jgi:osmotically-inducible protein OsmY
MKTLIMLSVLAASVSVMGCATTRAEREADRDRAANRETAGEIIDDATTTTQVNALIVGDSDARYFKIDVTTTRGEVVLEGRVNNRDTEGRLIAKIRELKGVRSVRSFLRLDAHAAN